LERDTLTKYRSLDPHGMHGGGLSPSFAFGGSSTVWGVTVIPYRKYEIKKWPITGKQFEQQFADRKQTFNSNAHHIGTTRMSDNPKTGVVDSNGRVHGINNLYVGGS